MFRVFTAPVAYPPFFVFLILACTSASADDLTEAEIRKYQNGVTQSDFLTVCVKPQPNFKDIRSALAQAETKPMPAKLARAGGVLLGVREVLELIDIVDQTYEGKFVVSKELSSIAKRFIATPIVIGTARSRKLKRDLSICSANVINMTFKDLRAFMTDLVGREPDYKTVSVQPDGTQTAWLNWNTSGTKTGILLLGIASPVDSDENDLSQIYHLVAIGLQRN